MSEWSRHFGRIAVAASGGVDSSLICGALKSNGHEFACATIATRDPSGDETAQVRMLADHLNVKCLDAVYDDRFFDPLVPASAGLPVPRRRSFVAVTDALLERMTAELGAQVMFDGNGGDSLFCFLHSALPVIDRLRSRSWEGTHRSLLDMCGITGCDLSTMVRAVLRGAFVPPRTPFPADATLLSPDVGDRPPRPLVPWLDGDLAGQPGKVAHLALIMHAQNQVHGLSEGLPRFSPLMSQPVLEHCLSVPSWVWARGGINRAVAREAFRAELPDTVLTRTSKAGPDSFLRHLFTLHREVIRDMLLGGLLRINGLLDEHAVEAALKASADAADERIYRLLDLVETEAWARSWSD